MHEPRLRTQAPQWGGPHLVRGVLRTDLDIPSPVPTSCNRKSLNG